MAALMPAMIQTMKNQKQYLLNQYQAQKAQQDQNMATQQDATAMGQAFDAARNDDTFYLPPEAFQTADFQRGIKLFLSPDGHAVRFTVFHQGDPLSEEGTSHIEPLRIAAADAIKGTPLEGSTVYVGGSAAMYKDMQQGADYDLLIAAVAALILIFLIMVVLTRAVAAAAVIVGTVVLSLGASFGLSVLIWQHLIGIPLHWMVLPMSVIVLLAVGADYNLLLVSRMKEELHAGLHTGIIRSMAGTGSVVTSAGLVFAFTMIGHGGQRPDRHRPGRHHHRAGPAVRHPGGAFADDAVAGRTAGTLVLVAAAGAPASGAPTLAQHKGSRAYRLRITVFHRLSRLLSAGLVSGIRSLGGTPPDRGSAGCR